MLRHATKSGANVIEETRVTEIEWDGDRPIAATWKVLGRGAPPLDPTDPITQNKNAETGRVAFDYLVDASGRAGIISVKYLKNRTYNPEFKNVAFWTYWSGAGEYKPGTPRAGSPFFEALNGTSRK